MIEIDNQKKLLDITQICMDINNNSNANAFCAFSGHIQAVTVEVYYNGWKLDNVADYRAVSYLNKEDKELGLPVEFMLKNLNTIYENMMTKGE